MCLSWLLLVLLLGLPYAVRPRSCDWYKLLLLGCTLRPRSCSTLLALRHAHQLVSHGPSTVENGSSFLCCACLGRVIADARNRRRGNRVVERSPKSRRKVIARRLSSTSGRFWTLGLKSRGFRRPNAAEYLRARCRIAEASEGAGLLSALPATAAAKRNANEAPERELSHLL